MGCPLAEALEERLAQGLELPRGHRLGGATVRSGPGPRRLLRLVVSGKPVAMLLVFCGMPPHYRPWIEAFSLDPKPGLPCCPETPCSPLEDAIIELASSLLGPGHPFYIDYTWDEETMLILGRDVPPQASRLGYKLLRAGFTWVKHWYYPEGFMEGGEKLQGEKPVSPEAGERHLREALAELEAFMSRWRGTRDPVMLRALEYAEASRRLILEALSKVKD